MEKLRFIADTDWQSNVDGRPSVSLQIAFTIYFINLFPFIKLDAVTVRVISDFSLITSIGGSSDVKGYKLIPEAFPLMIKLPFPNLSVHSCSYCFYGYFPRIAFRRKTVNYSVLGIFQFSRLVCMR